MEYTAVYNTEKMKGVEYSFCAGNNEEAKEFCRNKFNAKEIFIWVHGSDFNIHIGDGRKTAALERSYVKKHFK